MKAVRFTRHGKADVLTVENIADPNAGANEALVRIEAASINPTDVKNMQGAMDAIKRRLSAPMSLRPGRD